MRKAIEDPKRLGKRIRALRRERQLSQEDLADGAYSTAYISIIENGGRRASHEALSHIATRLGITFEQLVSGRDPNEDVRLELEIQQAIAQIHAGDPAGARDRLIEARSRATDTGYQRALLRSDEGLGLAFYRLGDYGAAREAYERADELAGPGSDELRTTAVVGIARCEFQGGKPREAIHRLESHVRDLKASPAPDPAALLETYAAMIPGYFEAGLIDRAKEVASEGSQLAAEVGDPEQLACLYMNRAGLLLTQGQRRDALASLALADEYFRQLGWHTEVVKVAIAKSVALVEDGRADKAEEVLRAALESEGSTPPTDEARALTQLSEVVRGRGALEEALALAKEAVKVAKALPVEAAEANREAGWCEHDLGDHDAALKHWQRALKLFKESGNHEEMAKTSRVIGDHYHDAGNLELAAKIYREGLDALEELR